MAYPAYRSSATAGASSPTASPSKPAGLAIGDILLGWIVGQDPGGSVDFTTPTGWTLICKDAGSQGGAALFGKIADANDVAASSFSFTTSGQRAYAVVAAYSTDNPTEVFEKISHAVGLTATGFTPDNADGLFIIFTASEGSAIRTSSTYAIATANPGTWTERADAGVSDGVGGRNVACADAFRGSLAATGNATAVLSGAVDASFIAIVSLTPTPLPTTPLASAVNRIPFVGPINTSPHITQHVNVPTSPETSPMWSNPSKHDTAWDNEPKST